MAPSSIPLLLLDETARKDVLHVRFWRTSLHPIPFLHPDILADHITVPSPSSLPISLPWNRFESLSEELPPGPVILLACVPSIFTARLDAMLTKLSWYGRPVHLVLSAQLSAHLDPESLMRLQRAGMCLILPENGTPYRERIATCLEDLSLVLTNSPNPIKGAFRWIGTSRSQESMSRIVRTFGKILKAEGREHPALLVSHCPAEDLPELQFELEAQRISPSAPVIHGRSCPDGLRHSLRLGAFLPLGLDGAAS